jgi:hypothetical protein
MSALGDWRLVAISPATVPLVSLPLDRRACRELEPEVRRSSCRFEVKVTTPHFEIAQFTKEGVLSLAAGLLDNTSTPTMKGAVRNVRNLRNLYKCDANVALNLVGTEYAYKWSMFPTKGDAPTDETVTWLPLITDIHRLQIQQLHNPFRENMSLLEQTKGQALHRAMFLSLTRKTRSWDFMPPEIVRPVASTTLGCIVSMVHRMDMVWVDFRPDEGVIRARGAGRSFTASRLRGLGLVIEYDSNGQFTFGGSLRVPSSDADKVFYLEQILVYLCLLLIDGLRYLAWL